MTSELEVNHIVLIAISCDSYDVLKNFAQTHGITFPLLSDAGSRVMSELGVVDRHLDEHHVLFGVAASTEQWGAAYPITFALDIDGTVAQKGVQENYRTQERGGLLLDEAFGLTMSRHGSAQLARCAAVELRVYGDSDGCVPYQKSRLLVQVAPKPGWQNYAQPTPAGYFGLTVAVDSVSGLVVGEPSFPPARSSRVAGLLATESQVEVQHGD